jgi:hypothetical protein
MLLIHLLIACEPAAIVLPEVVQIRVEPAEVTLVTGATGGEPVTFTAIGTDSDGRELTLDQVEWSVSNRVVGEIDESGVFTPAQNGGRAWVTARLAGLEAVSNLTVLYEEEIIVEGTDKEAFRNENRAELNFWLYPEDGVNIPRNTPGIRFMWQNLGAISYRLQLTSSATDLIVYTNTNSWTADEATWQKITATNAGGEVELKLAAATADTVYVDAPRRVAVNRLDGRGSIIYWSTSSGGLMELPYAEQAFELITTNTTGRCVACHTVSETGLVAFAYDGGNQQMGVKRLEDLSDIIPVDSGNYGNFFTFSPDGRYLLAVSYGALQLREAETGVYLWDIPTGYSATHADWSPDGEQLVFVAVAGYGADWTFTGGSLMVMDHLGDGVFSAPRPLFVPTDGRNAYYPSWSPDGEWIAFNQSYGDAYDDYDAKVYVMPSDGSTAPIALDRANQTGDMSNSWPQWGPLPDDDILWLAFSSRRAYGDVVANQPQIWVAAFDPYLARQSKDPSFPAFWMPNQDPAQNNHLPFWTDN